MSKPTSVDTSDFMLMPELSRCTARAVKTLYDDHYTGRGELAPILTKLGGRLGCWREDYEAFKQSRRRLHTEPKLAA